MRLRAICFLTLGLVCLAPLVRGQTPADGKIVASVCVYPDPANGQTLSFTVHEDGTCRESWGSSPRFHSSGPYQLPAEARAQLDTLLSELPESQPAGTTKRITVSFQRQGKLETRVYDGTVARDTLQALLAIPSLGMEAAAPSPSGIPGLPDHPVPLGEGSIFAHYRIGSP